MGKHKHDARMLAPASGNAALDRVKIASTEHFMGELVGEIINELCSWRGRAPELNGKIGVCYIPVCNKALE